MLVYPALNRLKNIATETHLRILMPHSFYVKDVYRKRSVNDQVMIGQPDSNSRTRRDSQNSYMNLAANHKLKLLGGSYSYAYKPY